MNDRHDGTDLKSVLFVCTGNIFRSPIAEAFFSERARRRGLGIEVRSAGTHPGNAPVSPVVLEIIGEGGGWGSAAFERKKAQTDIPTLHVPTDTTARPPVWGRPLDKTMLAAADLVVGMAREHVREIVVLAPRAWKRSFTLKELVRRGESVGPRKSEQPLGDWLSSVSEGRRREELMGISSADDVEDPVGAPPARIWEISREISGLVDRLLDLIEPS